MVHFGELAHLAAQSLPKTLVRHGMLEPMKCLKAVCIFATIPTCCASNPWRGKYRAASSCCTAVPCSRVPEEVLQRAARNSAAKNSGWWRTWELIREFRSGSS
jgi:hypothetical protein